MQHQNLRPQSDPDVWNLYACNFKFIQAWHLQDCVVGGDVLDLNAVQA